MTDVCGECGIDCDPYLYFDGREGTRILMCTKTVKPLRYQCPVPTKVTLFSDGACPMCRKDIERCGVEVGDVKCCLNCLSEIDNDVFYSSETLRIKETIYREVDLGYGGKRFVGILEEREVGPGQWALLEITSGETVKDARLSMCKLFKKNRNVAMQVLLRLEALCIDEWD